MLTSLRYETGPLDGLFGPRTQAAVQWFQVKHRLRPTGIVAAATLVPLRTLSRSSPGTGGAVASSELEVPPLPAAGWHGRPIRNPRRPTSAATPSGRGPAIGLLPGAGYRSAGGSQRVRRVQRTLRRLGYRPGPVDGRFGPRTKAAVQWFQMKHGLRPHGTVDALTSEQLRTLTSPGGPAQAGRKRATAPVPPSRAARPPRATTQPSSGALHDADERDTGVSPLLLVLAAALGAAVLALLTLRRIRPERAKRVPPPERVPPRDSTPGAAAASTNSHAGAGGDRTSPAPAPPRPVSPAPAPPRPEQQDPLRVVGYASAQDQAELQRQAAAIERACRERGWTLACVIRENGSANGNGRKRPGFAHAVKQVREGLAGRVVVDSLDHLGHSEDDARVQLRSLGADDIDLVALHAGGNGTPKRRRRRLTRA
jgi:peptidoglycan hydrolase-like protein with peptidoglycan-binding domain